MARDSNALTTLPDGLHPSGAVDVLGYIFDLINIKQKDNEPFFFLKVHFSQSFSSLKLGGISIDSALQVSFMLCILLGL